jgi:lysozyme
MVVNERGIDIIKEFEGLRLTSYLCPAKVWTIGYGHTGPDVYPGLTISKETAEQLLRGDLLMFEHGVDSLIETATENEFSAMVSLAFNIGLGNFKKSSVLRNHNLGKRAQAANSFLLWIKGGGRQLPGLIRRRNAERSLYLLP